MVCNIQISFELPHLMLLLSSLLLLSLQYNMPLASLYVLLCIQIAAIFKVEERL